jgi:glycosyltransferase involved in cell wall biosynthesis
MDIWLVKLGELTPYSGDVRKMRTSFLGEELVRRGHEVIWWCSEFNHSAKAYLSEAQKVSTLASGISVRYLRSDGYKKDVSIRRYLDHRRTARDFKKRCGQEKAPDCVVVSMPDYNLAYEVVRFCRQKRIPVIVDVRDLWPDIFLDMIPAVIRPALRMMLYFDFKKLVYLLDSCTGLTASTQSHLDFCLAKLSPDVVSKKESSVFYLGAPPIKVAGIKSVDACNRLNIDPKLLTTRLVVGFVGSFGKVWHPGQLVRAARILTDRHGENAPIFLLGGDGQMREAIAESSEGLRNVVLLGWLTHERIRDMLSVCHLGAIPSTVETTNFTNKAFTDLSASLPIAASVSGDLKKLIEERGCGFNYDRNRPDDLADALDPFINEPRLLEPLRRNATCVFEEMFEESKIYKKFANFVEAVAGREATACLNTNEK